METRRDLEKGKESRVLPRESETWLHLRRESSRGREKVWAKKTRGLEDRGYDQGSRPKPEGALRELYSRKTRVPTGDKIIGRGRDKGRRRS